MNRDELRNWDLMQNCARVVLVRGHNQRISPGSESPETVDRCVRLSFGGDWTEFERWAMAYAENGCGVAG